jgi:hypothetical protein
MYSGIDERFAWIRFGRYVLIRPVDAGHVVSRPSLPGRVEAEEETSQ